METCKMHICVPDQPTISGPTPQDTTHNLAPPSANTVPTHPHAHSTICNPCKHIKPHTAQAQRKQTYEPHTRRKPVWYRTPHSRRCTRHTPERDRAEHTATDNSEQLTSSACDKKVLQCQHSKGEQPWPTPDWRTHRPLVHSTKTIQGNTNP